jgi:hypothetical protein
MDISFKVERLGVYMEDSNTGNWIRRDINADTSREQRYWLAVV